MTLWMSIVPPLPMFVLSAVFEGPERGWQALADSVSSGHGWLALASLVYIVLVATVLGSGIWTALMRRYPASVVAPFSLLVPVVGFTAAWLVLGERPNVVELAAGAVVVLGVLLGSLGARRDSPPPVEVQLDEGVIRPSRIFSA